MKKKVFLVVGPITLIGLFLVCWEYYRNKLAQTEWERKETLKSIRIQSKSLEQRAKFLDLKLGSSIKDYSGFGRLDVYSMSSFADESAGEESWGYFGKNLKYSLVGPFRLLDPVSEIERLDGKYGQPKYKNYSKTALTVFTFKGSIYKITAKIKAEGSYTTPSDRFNTLLRSVYGPCVIDNGYNEVDYTSNDERVWESQNVTLTTRGEFKQNYIQSNGRWVHAGSDHITHVEYIYLPLAKELANVKANKANKIINEGTEKL